MIFPIAAEAPEYTKDEVFRLMQDVDTCPLKNSGVRVVHPVGDGSSGIFMIGEAPGEKEDLQGEPFVGASGKFLNNRLLPTVGLTRHNIYLTNIVKCRPPNNRDPLPVEKDAWSPVLLAEIISQKPELIVCLGRHSMGFFLPEAKISQAHGKTFKVKLFQNLEVLVMPVYHPAVALYNPKMAEVMISDFAIVKDYIREGTIKSTDKEEKEVDSLSLF